MKRAMVCALAFGLTSAAMAQAGGTRVLQEVRHGGREVLPGRRRADGVRPGWQDLPGGEWHHCYRASKPLEPGDRHGGAGAGAELRDGHHEAVRADG